MTLDLPLLADLARARVPDALFITVSGAHLYGFPSEDSDIDLRGCYQLPLREMVGLRRPEETREPRLVHEGTEVEMVVHEIGKYLRLLCKNNGYILEQIFSPLVVMGGNFLDQLRPLAQRCVTKHCYHHYRGFLQTQLKLLDKQEVKKAKTLLYAYRVLFTGIHLMYTGEVQSDLLKLGQTYELPFVGELIHQKQAREHGELVDVDHEWHRSELRRGEERLTDAFRHSSLPELPAREEVHDFLVHLRLPTIENCAFKETT